MLDLIAGLPFDLSLLIFLLGAVLLDLFFGDPKDWPHPVRLLGRALTVSEHWARHCFLGPVVGGGMVVIGLAICSFYLTTTLVRWPLMGELLALYLSYAGLAWGCLLHETGTVLALLENGDLAAARVHLAGLVSRDTADLDEQDTYRALAETLSENFNDGFVAPLFWLALGGPATLWAYKAVSTTDSMWGYRTERFARIGKVGARLDDILAFIPARLSAICIWCAGLLILRSRSWMQIMAEARRMDSPNAGWPMSAAAHVVGAGMGGPTRYHGEIKNKPRLGPDLAWNSIRIRTLRQVVQMAALLAAACIIALGTWLAWWTLG